MTFQTTLLYITLLHFVYVFAYGSCIVVYHGLQWLTILHVTILIYAMPWYTILY